MPDACYVNGMFRMHLGNKNMLALWQSGLRLGRVAALKFILWSERPGPSDFTVALISRFDKLDGMIKSGLLRLANSMGFQIIRSRTSFSDDEQAIISSVKDYTATSAERIVGLINAVKYVVHNKIDGAIVECGVWRGGSMMAAMHALLQAGDSSRNCYLFDTFEGMSKPTTKDVQFDGATAQELLNKSERNEESGVWCIAGMEEVRKNVCSTGYPKDKVHMVQGRVEDTIPMQAPEKIALLRLDTDWYESTAHELKHLYPRLSPNGVLIIDDYGHWRGARQAVDEYFAKLPFRPLLNRLDYTGRLAVKPNQS